MSSSNEETAGPAPVEPPAGAAAKTGPQSARSDAATAETAEHAGAPLSARLRAIAVDFGRMALVVLLALAGRSCLIDHYVIPSGSMIPTLMEGDRVFVVKARYGLRLPFTAIELLRYAEPRRGDIMVFSAPTDGTTFIKRVAAIPGDVVSIRDGHMTINGDKIPVAYTPGQRWPTEQLPEVSHLISLESYGGPDFGPITVPRDHYLMIGDNRGNSQDSRSWGFLPRAAILGEALRIYYRSGDGLRWSPL